MNESGLLGLYWSARPDHLEDCGRRAYETLRALQSLGYEHYYFPGRSRRDALKRQLEVTEKNVLTTLSRGVNRRDLPPREPIPELGWRMRLWSGGSDDESYSISITCGGYSKAVGNSVVLQLPSRGRFSISASPERAVRAYEALLSIWEPAQAVLCEGSIEWEGDRIVPAREPLALYRKHRA